MYKKAKFVAAIKVLFAMQKIQFKITLEHTDPLIWRLIEVPDRLSFFDLHLVIQVAMGWEDEHFYHFDYNGKIITEADDDGKMEHAEDINAELFYLKDAGFKQGQSFPYLYDFVDEWLHTIDVVKVTDVKEEMISPLCLNGEGNCPPEDCGGVEIFAHYLTVLKHTKHPEYDKAEEIFGPDYDPTDFDVEEVNECLVEVEW